jgi:hypothetical protein
MIVTLNETPSRNVTTFYNALYKGWEPRDYTYQKDEIPTGEYHIILDFMVWIKEVPGITLFCRLKQTGQKIRLTVYRNGTKYTLGGVNVAYLPLGSVLAVQVEINGNGNPSLDKIRVINQP